MRFSLLSFLALPASKRTAVLQGAGLIVLAAGAVFLALRGPDGQLLGQVGGDPIECWECIERGEPCNFVGENPAGCAPGQFEGREACEAHCELQPCEFQGDGCLENSECVGRPSTAGEPYSHCLEPLDYLVVAQQAFVEFMTAIFEDPSGDVCDNDCDDFIEQFLNTFHHGPCECELCACKGNVRVVSCGWVEFPPGWCDPDGSASSVSAGGSSVISSSDASSVVASSTPASSILSSLISSVPSSPPSSVPSSLVSSIPTSPASSVPSSAASPVPSSPASSVPSSPLSSIPSSLPSSTPASPESSVPSSPPSSIPSSPESSSQISSISAGGGSSVSSAEPSSPESSSVQASSESSSVSGGGGPSPQPSSPPPTSSVPSSQASSLFICCIDDECVLDVCDDTYPTPAACEVDCQGPAVCGNKRIDEREVRVCEAGSLGSIASAGNSSDGGDGSSAGEDESSTAASEDQSSAGGGNESSTDGGNESSTVASEEQSSEVASSISSLVTCNDPDGRDYTTATVVVDTTTSISYPDECQDEFVLIERICGDDGRPNREFVDCGIAGCINGRCLDSGTAITDEGRTYCCDYHARSCRSVPLHVANALHHNCTRSQAGCALECPLSLAGRCDEIDGGDNREVLSTLRVGGTVVDQDRCAGDHGSVTDKRIEFFCLSPPEIYGSVEYSCSTPQGTIHCDHATSNCVRHNSYTCTDSDSADNPNIVGTVERTHGDFAFFESQSDTCKDASTVLEAHCDGSFIATTEILCPPNTSCKDGKCDVELSLLSVLNPLNWIQSFVGLFQTQDESLQGAAPGNQCEVCSRCGDGIFNVCDEAECLELGSCTYSLLDLPLGRACQPDSNLCQ